MAIVATVGGTTANSYVTLVEAQAYFDARFGSDAWDDASDPNQEKALLQAARQLSAFRFRGYKNNPAQALPFPRAYPLHSDPGSFASVVSTPTVIKYAQCEQALSILKAVAAGDDRVEDRAELQAQGVTAFTVGNLSEQFSVGAVVLDGKILCKEARSYLQGWIDLTGRITTECPRPAGRQIANGPWPEEDDE